MAFAKDPKAVGLVHPASVQIISDYIDALAGGNRVDRNDLLQGCPWVDRKVVEATLDFLDALERLVYAGLGYPERDEVATKAIKSLLGRYLDEIHRMASELKGSE